MLQQVLAVRRTVFHTSHHAHQLVVHVHNAEVDAGAFAGFDNLLFYLFAGFRNHLFDTCGVYASVGNEFVERQACYFAAYGVETGEDDGVGRVVDDYFHAS